jgi:2-keto-3-deoxy-L-rhamnonate aldolase RhmA
VHVARVAEAARANGKAAGTLCGNLTQLRAYRELGFTFLGCSSDGSILIEGATALAGGMRELAQTDEKG